MSNTEILTKAIQKAIDSGWRFTYNLNQTVEFEVLDGFDDKWDWLEVRCYNTATPAYIDVWEINQLIFNHDFAKALWGEKIHTLKFGGLMPGESFLPAWAYHLAMMVIADDPIQYLGANI